MESMEGFEMFCREYNLTYDFSKLGPLFYSNSATQMAYIVFKYSGDFKYDGSNQEY